MSLITEIRRTLSENVHNTLIIQGVSVTYNEVCNRNSPDPTTLITITIGPGPLTPKPIRVTQFFGDYYLDFGGSRREMTMEDLDDFLLERGLPTMTYIEEMFNEGPRTRIRRLGGAPTSDDDEEEEYGYRYDRYWESVDDPGLKIPKISGVLSIVSQIESSWKETGEAELDIIEELPQVRKLVGDTKLAMIDAAIGKIRSKAGYNSDTQMIQFIDELESDFHKKYGYQKVRRLPE